ncbi:hypothetical protein D3C74_386540 [compost metagenome]
MHTSGKIYAVEHLNFIPLRLCRKKSAHLPQNAALRVHHDIRRMGLKQVRGQPEARFTASAGAYYATIQVPGIGGIGGSGVHGKKLCSGQNDVVAEFGVDKGLYVLLRSPPGRAIFHIPPKLFCVFYLIPYHQPKNYCPGKANKPIGQHKARR